MGGRRNAVYAATAAAAAAAAAPDDDVHTNAGECLLGTPHIATH